ncbi:MAG TPA: lipocalin-like domain-containing protein [Lacipirellulaceae bacterium]|nr:lipocalin-like domain-containing protein [Lacipirellulaceae bacterium]
MNRRNIFGLSVITALGLVLLPSSALAQQKSLKDQLVGTWTLVSWERVNPDGSKLQAFGANPKGISVFDPSGRFALIIHRADLPKLAANDRAKGTADENKAVVQGSIAYFGTYSIDEAGKTINLKLESSSFPNQLGTAAHKRVITSLTADELKYTNPTATAGGQIHQAWKRAATVATN